jgi:hypothetical protein
VAPSILHLTIYYPLTWPKALDRSSLLVLEQLWISIISARTSCLSPLSSSNIALEVRLSQIHYAHFIILCFFLAALKSLMVIPRSPSPVPLEDRDIATLTEAEMRELLQRQRVRSTAMWKTINMDSNAV